MRKVLFAAITTSIAAFQVQAQPVRTDAHRAEAKQYRDAVHAELEKGIRLLRSRPTDAAIGAQSRRIAALINADRLSDSVIRCKGMGSFADAYWEFGLLPLYRGERNAKQEAARTRADYEEAAAKCDQDISGPQFRFGK